MSTGAPKRKLIEVSLPLEAINRESAREKSIRHGHPSTLHLWWARRPLAAARAVLFAQLVDDPSSHPDKFPTEEDQRIERERLHGIIERLVVWENTTDQVLLAEAHQEILNSTDGNPPPILDPFAGGGTIPLEAQRLGLEAHASDLNPVAVLINKALIEIPPKFADRPPVFPGLAGTRTEWKGAEGLAADVRAYGEWMRDEAFKRIGHHYPKATLDDGTEATVIAWIWARTVTCPNPACGIEMPLVRSWWLGKKKGKEAWIRPLIVPDPDHPSGKRVDFEIGHGRAGAPLVADDGTVRQSGAECIACGTAAALDYIRKQAQGRGLRKTLAAVVAEGTRRRHYCSPTPRHTGAADVASPEDVPTEEIPTPNHDVDRLPMYGMPRWCDAFTPRQLVAIATLSDLTGKAAERILEDARDSGMPTGLELDVGGDGVEAYAAAVATYLAAALSRTLNKSTAINSWDSSPKMEAVRGLFARQVIPMAWDFAEANIFGGSSGNYPQDVDWVARVLDRLPAHQVPEGRATQADASTASMQGALISTDPPYYDNIGYSDLSDFFYVWLRRSLRQAYPRLLSTVLVPKAEELVANPYRHGGKAGARRFFETGFREVFARAREAASDECPIAVYYAFKQSDATGQASSTSGWETLLDGMIRSGWTITATWPMRSELSNRLLGQGTNALASSIVLALRPRPEDASTTDRRGLIAALHAELPDALRRLQQGTIAPVDLPQAAIGPGMAVFSRYARVIDNDGSPMSVRSALARINEILDQVLSEQEGDFDPDTRFAIAWYRQHGFDTGKFGDADNLARARNTAVATLARGGILTSAANKVTLIAPTRLPSDYDVAADDRVSAWEILHHLIARLESDDGIDAAGAFLAEAQERPDGVADTELLKELAFMLFQIAEKSSRTQDALSFNSVATAWPEILDAARAGAQTRGEQTSLDLTQED